jgi:histone H3/H4
MSEVTSSRPVVKQRLGVSRKMIRRLVRNESAQYKGWIAAKLVSGEWPYVPTPAEAARLLGTHARLVHKALGSTPKPLTDAAIDRLIQRAGVERVWAALDRLTQPPLPLIAAEAAE